MAIAALVAGVVVPVLADARPASAAGVIVPPQPPGSGSGGGSGGGSDTGGAAYCEPNDWIPYGGRGLVDGRYYPVNADQPAYGVFPPCSRSGTWVTDLLDCQTAFEVWRFYGTKETPVQAWSASRAVMPNACTQTLPLAMVAPHPDDEYFFGPAGVPFRYPYLYGPDQTAISSSSGQGWSGTLYGGQWLGTTSRPFRGGGWCGWLSTPEDEIGKYFLRPGQFGPVRGSQYDTPVGATLREEFRRTYDRLAASPWGPEWARVAINAAWVGSSPVGADIVYGDGRPCSSDLDFYTALPAGQTVATPAQQKLIGGCWINVRRLEQGWYLWETGETVFSDAWWYPEYYSPLTWRNDPYAVPELNVYAYVTALEVGGRWVEQNPDPTPLIPREGGPLSAPLGLFGGAVDAPTTVYRGTECGMVSGAVGQVSSGSSSTTSFPAALDVQVTVPEVGQVGGQLNPSEVRTAVVTPAATADGPFVESVDLTVTVNAPAGYRESDWSRDAFTGAGGNGSVKVRFLRATEPGAEFTVSVTGTARLRGIDRTTTSIMLPCAIVSGSSLGFQAGNPTAGAALCPVGSTGTGQAAVYKTVPINALYAPDASFPVVGATEIPRPSR